MCKTAVSLEFMFWCMTAVPVASTIYAFRVHCLSMLTILLIYSQVSAPVLVGGEGAKVKIGARRNWFCSKLARLMDKVGEN